MVGSSILRFWIQSSLGLLTFLGVVRIYAFLYYGQSLDLTAFHGDLLKAFVMGTRFDVSAVAYFNTVPMLLFIAWWFGRTQLLEEIFRIGCFLWFSLLLPFYVFVTIVDFLFYDYFQDHLNTLIFGFLNDDTVALVKTMAKDYNSVPYLFLFIFGWIWWVRYLRRVFFVWPMMRERDNSWAQRSRNSPLRWIGVPIGLFLMVFVAARGSLGLFPLNVADASVSRSPFVNYLAFSGFHAFVRAVQLQSAMETAWNINADYYGYHARERVVKDLFGIEAEHQPEDLLQLLRKQSIKNPWASQAKPHVVVIMAESFGLSWLRYHQPKMNLYGALEKHFHQDRVFENFLPSMTATIGSLSAFMVNTPHRPMGEFLTEGKYFNVPFRSAPALVYKAAGYKTRFIYGGAIGWRNVDRFARLQGFDSIEGDFEIEKFEVESGNQPLEKHDWGNHDESVFRYLHHSLIQAKEPQFILVMTTTNHPPFEVPKSYKGFELALPQELIKNLIVDEQTAEKRFRVFQYANHVLGEFLDQVKASDLAQKTLIAVTGDHGFLLKNFEEDELLQKWQVPFYLYVPDAIKTLIPKIDSKLDVFASHPDIMPTLFDLSLSEAEYFAMGESLLSAPEDHAAYHYSHIALNRSGAILALPKDGVSALSWVEAKSPGSIQSDRLRLVASPPSEAHQKLVKKYKATMSFLDYFFESERKFHENSRR